MKKLNYMDCSGSSSARSSYSVFAALFNDDLDAQLSDI